MNVARLEKESLILLGAVVVMTAKIALGVFLYHRWRTRRAAAGSPVSVWDELE